MIKDPIIQNITLICTLFSSQKFQPPFSLLRPSHSLNPSFHLVSGRPTSRCNIVPSSLSFVPLCQQHASEHLSFVSHTSGQQQLQSTDQLQCGRRVTSLNKQTIWLSEQDMTNACNSVVFKALNFATVTVRRSLSSRCNLAYSSRCSFGKIHMESRGKSDSRGALIVLEGLDRCGKTSQCARLHSYLVELGHAVELWRFPDRNTGVGQMISSYLANESNLDDHAVHLLFSANRWEKRSLMESKLRSGTTLIVDRYSFSGVAFSSAKGLDVEWCKAPEVGLLAPDVVVYLDISPEKAAERGGYGGERYEKLEFQKKVAQSYKTLCDSTWKMIDATLPIEDVEKQLRQIVTECMLTCQNGKPISELWQN